LLEKTSRKLATMCPLVPWIFLRIISRIFLILHRISLKESFREMQSELESILFQLFGCMVVFLVEKIA